MLLPRGYISHSQIECFKNKKRYTSEYLESGRKLNTRYMEFGKKVAKMIEEDRHHEILPGLPVYPLREHVVLVDIGGVPLLCKIDDIKEDFTSLRDKKTGLKPWSQTKAQKSEQLLTYAVAVRKKYGVVMVDAWIDWLETKDDIPEAKGLHKNPELYLTGKYESYQRIFDVREIDRKEKEIEKIGREISKFYEDWLDQQL